MSDSKFNKDVIQKIANLARLQLTPEQANEFSEQLSKIILHFDEISSINTEGVEPLITPSEIEYTLREDSVKQNFHAEEMVANAPDKQGNLFKVPPVV
ncbi:MAG: Asp-tRNA(Asn)/Glu-tRNA(Gln) amidotransferase subunit GatC [Pseudobdellovibrio sp.]|nr:Asp-tRNA(Asn)/Glu-tRNA(Gln) amidotransferase subunit GatC [Pseudobdellovibrio sp.]